MVYKQGLLFMGLVKRKGHGHTHIFLGKGFSGAVAVLLLAGQELSQRPLNQPLNTKALSTNLCGMAPMPSHWTMGGMYFGIAAMVSRV